MTATSDEPAERSAAAAWNFLTVITAIVGVVVSAIVAGRTYADVSDAALMVSVTSLGISFVLLVTLTGQVLARGPSPSVQLKTDEEPTQPPRFLG